MCHTDRRTDRRTDGFAVAYTVLAARCKNDDVHVVYNRTLVRSCVSQSMILVVAFSGHQLISTIDL